MVYSRGGGATRSSFRFPGEEGLAFGFSWRCCYWGKEGEVIGLFLDGVGRCGYCHGRAACGDSLACEKVSIFAVEVKCREGYLLPGRGDALKVIIRGRRGLGGFFFGMEEAGALGGRRVIGQGWGGVT